MVKFGSYILIVGTMKAEARSGDSCSRSLRFSIESEIFQVTNFFLESLEYVDKMSLEIKPHRLTLCKLACFWMLKIFSECANSLFQSGQIQVFHILCIIAALQFITIYFG